MRKFLSQMLLIVALCVPWVTQAQTVATETQIGSVSSSTTTSAYPLNGYYNYSLSETIIDADEIGDGAQTITSISFYYNASYSITSKSNCKIYLQPTSKTSFSSSSDLEVLGSNAVEVYSGNLNCVNGWNTFVFSTPYAYDGVSNLMIIVDDNTGSYDGSSRYFVTTACTGNKTLAWYSDSSNPDPTSSSYSGSKYVYEARVVMKLNGNQPMPSCPKVSNLLFDNITANTATATWTAGGSETSWQYLYGTQGFTPDWDNAATATTASLSLSNLTGTTNYDFYVRAYCSATDQSKVTKGSFKTVCPTYVPIPYAEGFEDAATGLSSSTATFVDCWTRINDATSPSNQGYPYVSASSAHDGSKCLSFYQSNSSSYPTNQIAVLPQVNTAEMQMFWYYVGLQFYAKKSSSSYDGTLIVGVMTDSTDASTFEPVQTVTLTTSYQNYLVTFENYSGQGAYVAIKCPKATSSTYQNIYVDDVALVSCFDPSGLAVSNITTTSATLAWTENGMASTWKMQYSTDNTNWTDVMSQVGSAQMPYITTNPYVLANLEPNTQYYVRVKSSCGGSNESGWTDPVAFRTPCVPVSAIPFAENFETFNSSADKNCWVLNSASASSSAAVNGTYGMQISSGSSSYGLVVLPQLDNQINVSTLSMRFNAKRYGSSSTSYSTYTSAVQVGVMTDPSDTSTFTRVATIDLTALALSAVEPNEVELSSYQGNGHYVAFYAPKTASSVYNYIYIDDVELIPTANCKRINAFAVTEGSVTSNSASLAWTPRDSSVTTYQIAYGTDTNVANMTTVNVSGFSYALSSLTSQTTYYAYVRAKCGGSNVSEWSDRVSFRTSQTPVVIDAANAFVDDFENDNKWELNNGTQTNAWYIDTAVNNGGSHALYISDTMGALNRYAVKATSTVYATKRVTLSNSGMYKVSFDWMGNGEGSSDYLRVALAPATAKINAGTLIDGISSTGLPAGWIALDGGSKLNLQSQWQSVSQEMALDGGEYYLVALWRNDASMGTQPPAAIDNFNFSVVSCPRPTQVVASNVTGDAATISWKRGSADQSMFFVAYSDNANADPSTLDQTFVEDTTITLEGLSSLTNYYVYVAALCDDYSDWSPVCTFQTMVRCDEGFVHLLDTVGNGNSTTYSSVAYTYSYYNYPKGYSSVIYTAEDLGAQDLYNNNVLGRIFLHASGTGLVKGMHIYMQNVDNATFSGAYDTTGLANMTEVFSGDVNFNGWTPIVLGNAFSYDPSKNLKVTFVRDTNITATVNFYYTSKTGSTIYGYKSSATAANYSMSTSTYRPDMILEMCSEVPNCIPVRGLEIASMTSASATVAWSLDDASQDNFIVAYGSANDPEDSAMTVVNNINTTSYTFPIAENHTYNVFVKAVCPNGESEWRSVSFETRYCQPSPTSVDGDGIGNVTFGVAPEVVNNNTTKVPIYADHSNLNGAAYPGSEVSVAITYKTGYTYGTVIWVDWNSNFDFESNEVVYVGTSTNSNPTTLTATFNVPANQPLGYYRMRIAGADNYYDNYVASIAAAANANACPTGTYTVAQDYTLHVVETPSCMPPLEIAVNDITSTGATVSWENDATNFVLAYSSTTADVAQMTQEIVEGTAYSFTDLTPNTTYHFALRSICGLDTTDWTSVRSFMTAFVVPYYENFADSTTLPSTTLPLPDGWIRLTGLLEDAYDGTDPSETSSGWSVVSSSNGLPANHVKCNIFGTSCRYWLVSPAISIDRNADLFFNIALTKYNSTATAAAAPDDQFVVLVTTDNGATWSSANELARWNNAGSARVYDNISNTGEDVVLPLAAFQGQTVRIAFYGESTTSNGDNDFHFGSIAIEQHMACAKPTQLVANDSLTTATSTVLTWTPGDEGQNNFTVVFGPAATAATPEACTFSMSGITANTCTLNNLTPNTAYNFFVKAVCGTTESNWSNAGNFRTACAAITMNDLPYTEDFESYGSGSSYDIDPCWTKFTNGSTAYPYPSSSAAINGERGLCFYGTLGSYSETYSYAALPELASSVDVTDLTLRMNVKRYSSTSSSYKSILYVGMMSDPEDLSTFVPVDTVDLSSEAASTVRPVEIDFANYAGTGRYVALYAPVPEGTASYYSSIYNYVYVDDVELIKTPTCVRPTTVDVEDITSNSAVVTWTPANFIYNDFAVAYAPAPSTIDSASVVSFGVTGTTAAITNLEPNTDYNVWVRTICGSNEASDWTRVTSFTTLNNNTMLTGFFLVEPDIQKGETVIDTVNHTVAINAYYGYDLSSVIFDYTLADWDAEVYIDGEPANESADFSSPLVVTVKAADTNVSQDWVVTVTVESCATPFDLTFSEVGRTSMNISWASLDSTNFHFDMVLDTVELTEEVLNSRTAQRVNDTTYTATNLKRGTRYYVYVRSNCGTNGTSDWVSGSVFTRDIDPDCSVNNAYQVGNSTSKIQYVPWSDYYKSTYSQQIYTASELAAAGHTAGYIGKIAFRYALASNYTKDVTVSMGTTTDAYFTSTYYKTVTPVSAQTSITFNGDGTWYEIAFDEPFYWDGTSNIVVASMCLGTNYPSSGTATFYGTAQQNSMSVYSRTDSGTPSTTSGTLTTNRADAKFFFCNPGTACPAVASVEASDVDVTTATLSWTTGEGDYANTYDVIVSETEITDFETIGTDYAYTGTALSANITGLNAYTQYYAYVRVHCDAQNDYGFNDGVSAWAAATFRTNSDCAVPGTPVATITGKQSANVVWTNSSASQSNNFRIVLSTSEIDPARGQVFAQDIDATSYELTGLESNTTYYCYVQNDCNGGTSPWVSCSFTTPVALPAVVDLAVSDIASNAFTATWNINEAQFANETQWMVACFEATGATVIDWTVVNTNRYVAYGLTGATPYIFSVRPYDGNNTGDSTSAILTTLPEQGDCVTVGNGNWSGNMPVTNYNYAYTQMIYTANNLSGVGNIISLKLQRSNYANVMNNMKVYLGTTTKSTFSSNSDWIPAADLTEVYAGSFATGSEWLDIELAAPYAYDGSSNLVVAISNGHGDWDNIQNFKYTSTASTVLSRRDDYDESYKNHPGTLSGQSPSSERTNIQFCFEPSSCRNVTHLAVSNVQGRTADVTWYPSGSETAWQYVLSTTGEMSPELASIATTVNTPTVALSSLGMDEDYYLFVRAICGDEEYSDWNQIHFVTLPLCSAPDSAIAVADIENGVTLRIVEGEFGTGATYDYQVWKKGHETEVLTFNNQTSPFVVNNLDALTTYEWRGRTKCTANDGYSRWTNGNDFYVCGTVTITEDNPLVENFDNTAAGSSSNPSFVSCWNRFNNAASYVGNPYVYNYSYYAFNGTNTLYWSSSAATATGNYTYGDYQYVVLPKVSNDVATLQLGFMGKVSSGSPVFEVGVMSDPDDSTTFVPVTTVELNGSAYAEYKAYLSFYQGDGKYVAIKASRQAAAWSAYLDSMTLAIAPSCIEPTHVAVNDVTANGATVSWTPGNPSQTGFSVAYGSDTTNNYANMTVVDATANDYALTNLMTNTHYYVRVNAKCGSDYSEWSNVVEFTTKCEAVTELPYTEGFEDYAGTTYNSHGVAPDCWSVSSTATYLPHVIDTGSYCYVKSGRKALTFYGSGTQYAALPEFATSLNNLQVSFYSRMESINYGTLTLGYITDDDVNFNTFTVVETYRSSSSMTEHTTRLANVPATAARLVFKWYYSSQYSCCIDDITVDTIRYTVNVASNDTNMGTVTGGGVFLPNDVTTLEATPRFGYNFVRWNDNSTENPRQFTVDNDYNLAAIFQNDPCVLRIADLPWTENFDGFTASTETKTGVEPTCWTLAHKDVTMTAAYEPQLYYDSTTTSVHSGHYSLYLGYRCIYAMPAYLDDITALQMNMYVRQSNKNYHLIVGVMSDLNDESTFVPVDTIINNSTSMKAATVYFANYTGDGRYIAFRNIFSDSYKYSYNYIDDIALKIADRTVNVVANNDEWGTVTGGGSFEYRDQATITATPNEHCHFVNWSDGSTQATRTFTVVENTTLTANFALDQYAVTASANNRFYGSVQGSGNYDYSSNAVLTAVPAENYSFVQWNDGVTANPRTVNVLGDTAFVATFAPTQFTLTVSSNDERLGTVEGTGSGLYNYNYSAILLAVPAEHHHLVRWSDGYTNPEYVFNITGNTDLMAIFAIDSFDVRVESADFTMGSVSGSNTYPWNTNATITATPAADYRFVAWSDGNTDNPRTINVTENGRYVAFFELTPCEAVIGFPYTENFDGYSTSTETKTGIEPKCWTLAYEEVDMPDDYRPQLYYDATGVSATSGNYCLYLGYRGYYAMPEMGVDVNLLKLNMNVRQTNKNYKLVVGVMSNLDDPRTFVPVDTINNATTGIEPVEVNFANYTGNGRFITFRNIFKSTYDYSYNYIDDITVSINHDACRAISEFPYTEDFEHYTTSTTAKTGYEPICWTLAHEDAAMTEATKPQVYYDNTHTNVQSGRYSLYLGNRGIYAMPAVDIDVNKLQMSMYLRQSNKNYKLVVGVMSDLNDESTFVPVDTISNTSTNMEYVEMNFDTYTGHGRYIAFRNIFKDNYAYSYNYIDDITLSVACKPIHDLPYVENFDSYTESTTTKTGVEPMCWTLAHEDVEMTAAYKPQLYYDATGDNAHSGNYSLYLGYRALYAMPAVDTNVNVLQISMYLRQSNKNYKLIVGVMSDRYDETTFVPVDTINNATTEMEYVEVDFAGYRGDGRYIAFRNIFKDAYAYSYNYIDDVKISVACRPVSIPYAENFDNYTNSTTTKTGVEPTCWILAHEDAAMTAATRPQIYYDANGTSVSSGNYSLYLGNRGIYAMPAVDVDVNTLQMNFNLRQSNTGYKLIVGVMSDLRDENTFVPVATINNATTAMEPVEVSFANYRGEGRYIAFRNIFKDNYAYSYNYIDDISITALPVSCDAISQFPYTEDFDSFTESTTAKTGVQPTCWKLAHEDVEMTDATMPQLYYDATNTNVTSGHYSLYLGYRGIYAMPAVDTNVNALHMTFNLRQSNAGYKLVVGVMSDLRDESTFVPVTTINNASTNMEPVEVSFANYTGNGRYIAFRNTFNDTYKYSYNYIDDITLDFIPEPECEAISQFPYVENFDNYTESTTAKTGEEPACWTLAHEDAAMTATTKPQLYYDATGTNVTSGHYSLYLGYRGIYAMPAVDVDVNALQMSFNLRQSNVGYQLIVGVMSDLDNEFTFVPVATINNASTNMEPVEVNFSSYSGNGRYIAFRNIFNDNYKYSYNYIDDIVLDSIPPVTCEAISEFPYTEDFESYTESTATKTGVQPTCWTQAHEDVVFTPSYISQIYYNRSYAHSGNYCLQLNYRGIFAMPAVDTNVNGLQMSFYLKQSTTNYQLLVGVISDLEDETTFRPVQLIDNSSTNLEYVTVSFENYDGDGKYIAFRNILASGTGKPSVNYIDDITIEAIPPHDPCVIYSLPFTEDFENYTQSTETKTSVEPTCWTLAHKDVASIPAAYMPQLYYDNTGNTNVTSGNYSLYLGYRVLYAMPAVDFDVNTLQMGFYLRQSNANYKVIVGVMSDVNDESTFVPVDTVNNSTTGMEYNLVNFGGYTGNGRHIAFRNIFTSNYNYSYNYIDDITIEAIPPRDSCVIYDFPFTETFERYTSSTTTKTGEEPSCWTLAHQYVSSIPADYMPQLYYDNTGNTNVHSGNYSLYLGYRVLYAMPAVDIDVNKLQMDFYLRQSNVSYKVVVGVMTDLTDERSFVPVDTVSNSTTGIEHNIVDFSGYTGNGRHIAFRNIFNDNYKYSYNYIDDITLSIAGTRKVAKNNTLSNTGVDMNKVEVRLFPNPTTGRLTVEADDVQKVEVFAQNGSLVATFENVKDIDISHLAAGIYSLRITSAGTLSVHKVVKK